jgi:hypothetical protein
MMTIDFVSMLAQAQQATKAGSIERVLSLAGNMAGVIPGSTDKIDFDYALDKYSALLNNDPKMMRTADEVAKIREDRAHQGAGSTAGGDCRTACPRGQNLGAG